MGKYSPCDYAKIYKSDTEFIKDVMLDILKKMGAYYDKFKNLE